MEKPLCVVFAGPVGSSKTPIAHYLSWSLNLPVFSSDSIRSELHEDFRTGSLDDEQFQKLKKERLTSAIDLKRNLILDLSVDRTWEDIKSRLEESGYSWFIISMDISADHLSALMMAKGYVDSLKRIDKLIEDHQNFLAKHGKEIGLSVTDQNFPDRLRLSVSAVGKVLHNG